VDHHCLYLFNTRSRVFLCSCSCCVLFALLHSKAFCCRSYKTLCTRCYVTATQWLRKCRWYVIIVHLDPILVVPFFDDTVSRNSALLIFILKDVMIELYRKNVWHDAKTVNAIATTCFSKSAKVSSWFSLHACPYCLSRSVLF